MQPILINIIGITVVLAFVVTTIMTLLSIFGHGNPPRYLVHIDERYKNLLFKSLVIELIVLCLGVASSNFHNVEIANEQTEIVKNELSSTKAQTELVKNELTTTKAQTDIAISNLLREYWKPNNIVNTSNETKLKTWLRSNELKDASITLLLHAESFVEKRSKAANDLILTPKTSYMPKQFDGRVGKIFVKNTSLYPFKVTLWHPDSEKAYKSWVINGTTKMFLSVKEEAINIGNDWGVQLGESEVKSIDDTSLWANNEWRLTQDSFFE
ncbi:MAG: hypothetical protein ABFS18_06780 [Thermodesulfobacteriota bacterium]